MRAITMAMLLGLGATAAAPRPASAPAIHRCVGVGGDISYQSAPCAAGARQDWVRPLPPPAPTPLSERSVSSRRNAPASVAATPAVRRGTPARSGTRARAPSSRARAPSPCERARRAADAIREQQWNRLGFRERSELDAGVARACAR
jgi:hypothetical protein